MIKMHNFLFKKSTFESSKSHKNPPKKMGKSKINEKTVEFLINYKFNLFHYPSLSNISSNELLELRAEFLAFASKPILHRKPQFLHDLRKRSCIELFSTNRGFYTKNTNRSGIHAIREPGFKNSRLFHSFYSYLKENDKRIHEQNNKLKDFQEKFREVF